MRNLIWLLLFTIALPALAEQRSGREGGNGGDDAALDFASAFHRAYAAISLNYPAEFAAIYGADLPGRLRALKILVVEKDLFARIDGQEVRVLSQFDARKKLVRVSRGRWEGVDTIDRQAWALHQMLMIAGLETAERFPVSDLFFREGYRQKSVLHGLRTTFKTVLFYRDGFCGGAPIFTGVVKVIGDYAEDWSDSPCTGRLNRLAWSYRDEGASWCMGRVRSSDAYQCAKYEGKTLLIEGPEVTQ